MLVGLRLITLPLSSRRERETKIEIIDMLLVGKEEILLAIILHFSERSDSFICLAPWNRLKNIISIV